MMPDAAPQLSDADLINQFILGTLPGMQQQPAAPSGPSASAPAPDQTGTPNQSVVTGISALANAGQQPTTKAPPPITGQGAPVTKEQLDGQAPMPAPQAPAAATPPAGVDPAAMIKFYSDGLQTLKRVPASEYTIGLQKTYADELSKWQGILQQQPGFQGQVAQAKHLGDTNQQIVNGQVQPLPGALDTTQQFATAGAEGTEGPKRVTQAVAPQQMRGAGASVLYPAGSPAASLYANLKQQGALPPNVDIDQTGAVTVNNTNPSSETIGKQFEDLSKMGDQAEAARQAQYQASLLKNNLNAIGTSGPLTQHLGELSALAKQLGVSDDTLKAMNIPSAPTIQQANAISLELLGSILRQTFPQRITNTDIATFRPSNPNVDMLSQASNYLIDKIVLPKAQRDIDRYGFATSLPQNDTQVFKQGLFKWDQEHPYTQYVAPEQAAPTNAALPPVATPGALPPGWSIKPLTPAPQPQGQQ